jgi:hypothetical protein
MRDGERRERGREREREIDIIPVSHDDHIYNNIF